ncbi:hypothetical protein GUITHDRAFT_143540 [Guillardia theta CCMP2712]|uniref:non-specific serine/threonine protein kinase n=1 Tax=Guillardia theta (strain CCMP2712) TaxID=905079 RepID=L1IU36_GUITC|nr:hypothetical protein GUITHDRAFT_143540 [Guillardia theta CCMP2712]EKX39335.1 hypothetical protein GUITHDRAFT_143540 [Guillardia theta CCMP2712]|eukprot:XP_005826315.1 hypothetical protein GUITHDRAFT_143540 [Guillardia theta CCMP2712]
MAGVQLLLSYTCSYICTCTRRLPHPDRVGYEDCFVEDGFLFVVMEFASGGCLENYTEPMTPQLHINNIYSIFIQCALALAYLHSKVGKGIVHRDFKPANVFLRNIDCVKVGDLGEGWLRDANYKDPHQRWTDDPTQKGRIVGTPYYLAPECWLVGHDKKNALVNETKALGVTLYELCTKTRPFQAKNVSKLAMCICKNSFAKLSTVIESVFDDVLETLITKLLEKDPGARLSCQQEWSAVVEENAVLVEALPPSSFLLQWGLRSWRPQISVGRHHIAGVSMEGELFTWSLRTGHVGSDDLHVGLGHGSSVKAFRNPHMIRAFLNEEGETMLMDSYEHVFTAVACGDRFTIAVTARGRMFTWGLNTCGQILRPQQIRVVRERGKGNELETRNQESIFVLDVAAGPEHAMMLADNGFVYTWGSGDSGRLGHGNEAMVSRPTQVWRTMNSTRSEELGLSCEATHVACGEAHSMAMTVEGFLYVWGCMEGGRLGLISAKVDGDFIADVDWKSYNLQERIFLASFSFNFDRVVDAAAGVRHNTIITKDRDDENEGAGTDNDVDLEQGDGNKQAGCTSFLYWWGENVGNEDNLVVVDDKDKDVRNRDERFYDDDDDDEFYRHVSERTDVATVAAGESFSCAITDDGKLYTWGLATSGQLGYHARAADTDQLLFSSKPRRVSMPMDLSITHVSCGAQICFAVGTPSTDAARAVLERNLSTTLEDNDRSLAMGREFAALAI